MSGNKILFVGCSLTYGDGLIEEVNDPKLWCNQIAKELCPDHQVVNRARKGVNNEWIFLETVSALLKEKYDKVFVEWTAIPRHNINIGLETYETMTMLLDSEDISTNLGTFKGYWINDLGNSLLMLHNDHWDTLKIVKYVNLLKRIHQDIYFINGMLPWPEEYFIQKKIKLPGDLPKYTQNLLNVDNRDDKEVFELYNMIHSQYQEYGGIHSDNWLNLYHPMVTMRLDTVVDNYHPGYKTQDLFSKLFLEKIEWK